ncbi:MAG: diadenylate cyclase [Aureliella sp.]
MQIFFEQLSRSVRLADVLDVGVVTVLVYAAMCWLRERASHSLGILLVSLGALYVLARELEMYMTTVMFQVGFLVGLIAIVIVFQQDMRRSIERLSSLKWVRGATAKEPAQDAIDILVEAISSLAELRIGALIVLSGKEPLDRHTRGGVLVDAHLSLELIRSIFDTQSPGHDGAVIIDGNRITHLGVHLPLSGNLSKIGPGGTRHAAALGASEQCDSLVIAVSEERGTITLAHAGQLDIVDSIELVDRLQNWYQDRTTTSDVAENHIIGRMGIKAFALLIACVLWFLFAYHTDSIQRTIVVPVEFRNVPESLMVDEPKLADAELTLSGSEGAFQLLDTAAIVVSIDLANIGERREARINASQSLKNVPNDLTVEQIVPSIIEVWLRAKGESPDLKAVH